MSVLGDRLLAVHASLATAGVPHAFGGAIALAYCTEEPRGTRDLDINIFLDASEAARVFAGLPQGVRAGQADVDRVHRDQQVRLWWDDTPVDLFFDAHEFHREVAAQVRDVPFEGQQIPVLSCAALTVFKAMFNRTRDWADIEAMVEAGYLDVDDALSWVQRLLGADDPVTDRLTALLN